MNWNTIIERRYMTNTKLKLLCDQLEESNDCMLALADTLCKYGHNTTDLLEQVRSNERIIEFCRVCEV